MVNSGRVVGIDESAAAKLGNTGAGGARTCENCQATRKPNPCLVSFRTTFGGQPGPTTTLEIVQEQGLTVEEYVEITFLVSTNEDHRNAFEAILAALAEDQVR